MFTSRDEEFDSTSGEATTPQPSQDGSDMGGGGWRRMHIQDNKDHSCLGIHTLPNLLTQTLQTTAVTWCGTPMDHLGATSYKTRTPVVLQNNVYQNIGCNCSEEKGQLNRFNTIQALVRLRGHQ